MGKHSLPPCEPGKHKFRNISSGWKYDENKKVDVWTTVQECKQCPEVRVLTGRTKKRRRLFGLGGK